MSYRAFLAALLVVGLPSALFVAGAACSSKSSGDTGGDGAAASDAPADRATTPSGPDNCSNGPPVTSFEETPADIPPPTRQCTKRCGDTSTATCCGGRSSTITALPSGHCTTEEPCSLDAVPPACDGDAGNILYVFSCQCAGGSWSCTGSDKAGAAVATCESDDAGDGGDGGS